MREAWKQVVTAVILGILLPRLILSGAELFVSGMPEQTQGTEPTRVEQTEDAATEETSASEPEMPAVYISVLTDTGAVMVMELENYVEGVVLAEMPAEFEAEALKAQAIVARTYALKRKEQRDRHLYGTICTDSACCQAFLAEEDYLKLERGDRASIEKVSRSVRATAGQVLTYRGALIEATYFSCSGGRTEDAAAVWGTDIPYLQSVDSPGEENAALFYDRKYFNGREFAAKLGKNLAGEPGSWLGKVTYTDGGGVNTIYIGGICYSGKELRTLLGLNSTMFTMTADRGGITVETWGRGHRVGMSQYGADAMAVSGKTCEEILSYYYHGTRIDKITDLG